MIVYIYISAMLHAVDFFQELLNEEIKEGHDVCNAWSLSTQKWPNCTPLAKTSLPAPLNCQTEYCTISDRQCSLLYSSPTYGYAVIHH